MRTPGTIGGPGDRDRVEQKCVQFPPSLTGYWRHRSPSERPLRSLPALPSIILMHLTPAWLISKLKLWEDTIARGIASSEV